MTSTANDAPQSIVSVKGGYRYADLVDQCEHLLSKYDFLNKEVIGTSVLGKPIVALILGTGYEQVHLNAAVHANEWITTPLLLRFIEELAQDISLEGTVDKEWEAKDWLEKVTIYAVPMVNPDGVDLSQDGIPTDCPFANELEKWNGGDHDFSRWKANIRGVDLNDQFPAYWEEEVARRGTSGPASQDYGGMKPLCEPEAICLAEFTRARSFDRVMSLHTQGRELYWNYRDMEPSGAEEMATRIAAAGEYQAIKLSGSDAGYKDWFISEFRRPGFTLEAGEGVNPLPPEQFEGIYEEVAPILAQFIRG
ncbi:peptidase M14 [Paenibacillus anaericanus]|uniref:Peptidase M14 n=1 Tax=Paenibacillus anaericanus TaxID=170367 RepID=A0A3S1BD42_9BACL|nr:M14 family metallocarboxypeptidase [Paenibacillus anaericanus]RUT38792.1 peptidase M14 [Paenibacillus anaericanus]